MAAVAQAEPSADQDQHYLFSPAIVFWRNSNGWKPYSCDNDGAITGMADKGCLETRVVVESEEISVEGLDLLPCAHGCKVYIKPKEKKWDEVAITWKGIKVAISTKKYQNQVAWIGKVSFINALISGDP